MLYRVANKVWRVVRWIWVTILIATIVCFIANVLVAKVTDIPEAVFFSIYKWLTLLNGPQMILLGFFGLFLIVTLLSFILTIMGDISKGGKDLRQYLYSIADANQDLTPSGISSQPQVLLPVSVPLDSVFIHLNMILDRPCYDLPYEQQERLEELRRDPAISQEQWDEQFYRTRAVWHSQMGREWLEAKQQNIEVNAVLKELTPDSPVAVILGSPGSGKSTTLRWFTLQMARALRIQTSRRIWNSLISFFKFITISKFSSRRYVARRTKRRFANGSKFMGIITKLNMLRTSLPEKLLPKQIPVLVRISEYAKYLEKNDIAFEQYFVDDCKRKYFWLGDRLLEEMRRGRCLVLFDGLDEVASYTLRQRVRDNIATFISNYSTEKKTAKHFNRFVVTSRIVGYESGPFTRYAHYTLCDLGDEQIKAFLTSWCTTVEQAQVESIQARKRLTPLQKIQVQRNGEEQRDRLINAMQNSPSIRRLASNPLTLTILALIQKSGKALPHRRIDLYETVTRTLLSNWNQDKGRKFFQDEEISLVEQLMSNLAYQLHRYDLLLGEAEVKKIAQRTVKEYIGKLPTDVQINQLIDTLRSSSGLFVETGQGLFGFMHRTFQEYYVARYLIRLPFAELQNFVRTRYHQSIWREPLLLLIAYKSGQDEARAQDEVTKLIKTILNECKPYDKILQGNLLFATLCVVDCRTSLNHQLQRILANNLFTAYGDIYKAGRYTKLQQEIEEIALSWLCRQEIRMDTPLLDAWRSALCNEEDIVQQEGAAHLLASIAPSLSGCPKVVLFAIVPPLLQLANVVDISYLPEEMREVLPQPPARSSSSKVEDYAFITLRLLDSAGPAGWLHEQWLKWSKEQPELLERLTQHSLEIGQLLTPAASPPPSPSIFLNTCWDTQLRVERTWKEMGQKDLRGLQEQLLDATKAARFPQAYLLKQMLDRELVSSANQPWYVVWETFLKEEMSLGRSATYQTCLHLETLLCKKEEQRLNQIADGLLKALASDDQTAVQISMAIASFYFLKSRDIQDTRYFSNFWYLRDLSDIQYLRGLLHLRDLQVNRAFADFGYFQDLRRIREVGRSRSLKYFRRLLYGITLVKLKCFTEKERIIEILCKVGRGRDDKVSLAVLFCLYSIIIDYDSVPETIRKRVETSIEEFRQQEQFLSKKHLLLVEAIHKHISRNVSNSVQSNSIEGTGEATDTIQEKEKAAELLFKGMLAKHIEIEQLSTLVDALCSENGIILDNSTSLLQNICMLSQEERSNIADNINSILSNDEYSYRLFRSSPYKYLSVDDVLFDILKELTERD